MRVTRSVAAGLAAALLGALWLGPLPDRTAVSFTAHMTLHMGIVAIVAPLLAVAVAGGRFDPARAAPRLFSAVPAAAVELAIVWAWHAPLLHHAARHAAPWFALEQGSFLAAGAFVWISAFGGEPHRAAGRAGAGVVALLLTSMHMTLLGALLALAPRPLYHGGASAAAAALDDQHLGGAIMLVVGGASYLAGGLFLSRRMLAIPRPQAAP